MRIFNDIYFNGIYINGIYHAARGGPLWPRISRAKFRNIFLPLAVPSRRRCAARRRPIENDLNDLKKRFKRFRKRFKRFRKQLIIMYISLENFCEDLDLQPLIARSVAVAVAVAVKTERLVAWLAGYRDKNRVRVLCGLETGGDAVLDTQRQPACDYRVWRLYPW